MAKWKYNHEVRPIDNVDALCTKFNLSDDVKEAMKDIAKCSYILGSNTCFSVFFKKAALKEENQ